MREQRDVTIPGLVSTLDLGSKVILIALVLLATGALYFSIRSYQIQSERTPQISQQQPAPNSATVVFRCDFMIDITSPEGLPFCFDRTDGRGNRIPLTDADRDTIVKYFEAATYHRVVPDFDSERPPHEH